MPLPLPSRARIPTLLAAGLGLAAVLVGAVRWRARLAPVEPDSYAYRGVLAHADGLAPDPAVDPKTLAAAQPLLARWWAYHPDGLDLEQLQAFTIIGAQPEAMAQHLDRSGVVGPKPGAFLVVPPALDSLLQHCPAVDPELRPLCRATVRAEADRRLSRSLVQSMDSPDPVLAGQAASIACTLAGAGHAAFQGQPQTVRGRALALFVQGCAGGSQARAALELAPPEQWMAILECSRMGSELPQLRAIASEQPATVAGALARYGLASSTVSSTTLVPSSP